MACSPSQRFRFFSLLLGFVETTKSIDGLAGLLLSGIEASHLRGDRLLAGRGIAVWNSLARGVRRGSYFPPAVFLLQSNRIGFIDVHSDWQGAFQQFVTFNGAGDSHSIFGPEMPGAAIGQSMIGSNVPGSTQMDGDSACKMIFKYGLATTGAALGWSAGGVAGTFASSLVPGNNDATQGAAALGAALGLAYGGASLGLSLGKELGGDICGGSGKLAPGTYYDPITGTVYTVTADGTTVSGDLSDSGPSIGDVDDPNFVNQGTAVPEAPYIDLDAPNNVSGGGDSSSGGSGGGEGGTNSGGSGDPGGTGTGDSGMEDPDSGSDESPLGRGTTYTGSSGLGSPTGGGLAPVHYNLSDPEGGGLGEPPVRRGFMQGGFAVTSSLLVNAADLQGNVTRVAPGVFQLSSVPMVADGALGPVLTNPGLLAAVSSRSRKE